MKTTKCIALLLAIVMTLALFAGCSNSPANDPATDAAPEHSVIFGAFSVLSALCITCKNAGTIVFAMVPAFLSLFQN